MFVLQQKTKPIEKYAFRNLREDMESADVTLAYEDGRQLKAHRVILASARMLSRNKHAHLLIYLRGLIFHTLARYERIQTKQISDQKCGAKL